MTTSQQRYPNPFLEPPSSPHRPADRQSTDSESIRPPDPPPPPPNWPPPWEDLRQLPKPPQYVVPPPQFSRISHQYDRSARQPESPSYHPGTLAASPSPSPESMRGAALPGALASFGERTLSFLIDSVAPVTVLTMLLSLAAHTDGIWWRLVISASAYIGLLGFGIWNCGYLQGTTGRSLGRRVVGTKLISIETGQPVGLRWAVARQIWHVADFGIGFLWPLHDSKRQTFADKIVGTVVVRVSSPTNGHAGEPTHEVSGTEDRRLGK